MIPLEVYEEKLKDTDLTKEEIKRFRDALLWLVESVIDSEIEKILEE